VVVTPPLTTTTTTTTTTAAEIERIVDVLACSLPEGCR